MAFYVPTPSWQRVGTGVGAVTIRCIGAVRVAVSSTEPAADAGRNYGWDFHGNNLEPFDALGGDIWVKAANAALSPDGFFSAIWIDGVGTFNPDTVLPSRVYLGALAPHYGIGPGKIAIHFDTDHTTRDGSGNVTALQNRGGGGAAFDAAVSGAAIPVSGKALQMAAAGGVPILANAADLQGVRFMFVCSTESITSTMRFFGGPATTMRIWNYGGFQPYQTGIGFERTGSTAFGTNKFILNHIGMHLFEIEMNYAAGTTTIYLDGAIVRSVDGATEVGVGVVAKTFPDFLIDRIGQGATGSAPFVGLMGDVLGITLGAGSATAIAAARAYLAARHGITLA